MTDLIRQQMFEFIIIFYAGGVSAFLVKTYMRFKEKHPVGRTTTMLQNIIFWILMALIVNTFVEFACKGEIAFYTAGIYIAGWMSAIAFDRFANS